jgi:hypothetical protein
MHAQPQLQTLQSAVERETLDHYFRGSCASSESEHPTFARGRDFRAICAKAGKSPMNPIGRIDQKVVYPARNAHRLFLMSLEEFEFFENR